MSTNSLDATLNSIVLNRAKIILGGLLILMTFFVIAGICSGIVRGDFDRVFIRPFRQFAADFKKAMEPTPTPTDAPEPTLFPTLTPKPARRTVPVNQQAQPVYSNCIRLNIREGEFASNKCYTQGDYDDLRYYLGRFSNAQFSLQSAENSIHITCNCRVQQECDFFKDSCERDKQQKSQAETDMNNYRGTINSIINRGK